MKKRLTSALLCAVMVLTLLPSAALAAALPTEAEAAQVLSALEIMTGDASGDLMLEKTITRAEFTKMVIAASPLRDNVGPEASTSPYPDVPRSHWAAGYIQAAVDAGLIRGNIYGYFEPERNITLAEGVTMALRLMGYADEEFSGKYPSGQMSKYRALELDKGVSTTDPNGPVTRRDALFLFYNLALTKTKDGSAYMLDLIKPGKNLVTAAGEINAVALVNSAMEGPLVASGAWQSKLPFDPNTARVYRGGVVSSLTAIVENDVVYYSKPMRTLWAYSNKATGNIDSVDSTSSPTSVSVAGKPYTIETSTAAYDLSDLGSFRVGDPVTLLLGRDNKVAAVLDPGKTSSTLYGMITSVAPITYEDAKGNSFNASTITVRATDGNEYSYRWDEKNLKAGALVQVTTGSGDVQIKRLSNSSLSGKVNAAGTRIGNTYTLSANVEILDTYNDLQAVRVYPGRLAGVSLTGDMVRFYLLDANGEVSKLILKEVTGDMHQYGVITSVNEVDQDMMISGTYVYDIGGVSQAPITGSKLYNVTVGPFVLKQDDEPILKNLDSVKLNSVDGHTAYASNQKYPISDSVAVYELRGNTYYYSSLSLVAAGGYNLTGWYDKPAGEGGCIRVIVARAAG